MAKKRWNRTKKQYETGKSITTKSWFGSHKDMVIEEISEKEVICEDDRGRYKTYRHRLDNGLADPNRYAHSRIAPSGAGV